MTLAQSIFVRPGEREETCELCLYRVSHLMRMNKRDPGIYVWGCSLHQGGKPPSPSVIPGNYSHEAPVFTRIPMWCPRPDEQVHKRPEPEEHVDVTRDY